MGGSGNDLLLVGPSGPADVRKDGALVAGLTASLSATAQNVAIIASNNGADIVSGGLGVDTLSFRSEASPVRVDLNTGLVYRAGTGANTVNFTDNGTTASYNLTAAIGELVLDAAGLPIFQFTRYIERVAGVRVAGFLTDPSPRERK